MVDLHPAPVSDATEHPSRDRLTSLGQWWSLRTDSAPSPTTLLVVCGDHGIAHSAGTSVDASQEMSDLLAGTSGVAHFAHEYGIAIKTLNVAESADAASGQAGTLEDIRDARARGAAAVDQEVDSGTQLLLLADIGSGATSAAVACLAALIDGEIAALLGHGSQFSDIAWMRKAEAVRDALARASSHEIDDLLVSFGGPAMACLVGVLQQAAVRGLPVLIDGMVEAVAAVLAERELDGAAAWWLASHTSTEPAHAVALEMLSLRPLMDLALQRGGGLGAVLATPIIQAAVRMS